MTELMRVENLTKHYPLSNPNLFSREKRKLRAVDGASFVIHEGEVFGVVGESGCGKSTLGRCIIKLTEPTQGSITFDGADITHMSRKELKPIRRDMQMVFQNPFSSFDPKYRIGQSLMEAGHVHGMSVESTYERVYRLLGYINLPEDVLLRRPVELSGGQLQRLAIARALVLAPKFIVADEPVSALDVSVQAQIINLLADLRKKFSMTVLFISHDMTVVEHLCDTVAVMYLGKIVEIAPTRELFSNIRHPYTKALLSSVPKADPDDKTGRIILSGEVPNAIDIPKGCRFASRCQYAKPECFEIEPELNDIGGEHRVACHFP